MGGVMDDWRTHAACRGMDTEIFFPHDGKGVATAQQICAHCPVARACLEDALRGPGDDDYGVRGGMSERERRRIRALRSNGRRGPDPGTIRKPIEHGTERGYQMHRRRGETACRACKDAIARAREFTQPGAHHRRLLVGVA